VRCDNPGAILAVRAASRRNFRPNGPGDPPPATLRGLFAQSVIERVPDLLTVCSEAPRHIPRPVFVILASPSGRVSPAARTERKDA